MDKLKFPNLEEILKLDKNACYSFKLFSIPSFDVLYKITYNDDENGILTLDYMKDGYCEGYDVYQPTKEDYDKLKENANNAYNNILSELLNITNEWDYDNSIEYSWEEEIEDEEE